MVVKLFVNVTISSFVFPTCGPENDCEQGISRTENMGINKMHKTNGNIANDHFEQHQNASYYVLIYANTIDCTSRVVGQPVRQSNNKRVHTCYGEEQPRNFVPKRQFVVIIFAFGVNGSFAFFVAFVVRGQSDDVGFRLEPTWPETSWVVFDTRATAIVGGDEHGKKEMRRDKHENPVAKIQEPIVAITKAAVDKPRQEVKAGDKTVNENERQRQPLA